MKDNNKNREFTKINAKIQNRVQEIVEEIKNIDNGLALAEVKKERIELTDLLKKHVRTAMTGGNIGFGKTNAAETIAIYGRAQEVYENDKNPLLVKYYQDKKKYSRDLQINLIDGRLYGK